MANPLDTDAGSELFGTYEAELKLVEADVNQKLDQIPELAGEERKAAIRGAERAIEEAKELVNDPTGTIIQYMLDTPLTTVSLPAGPNES